jgi:hypothetical protein
MAQLQQQIVRRITANADFTVSIEFDGGLKGVVDFKPLIQQGGVFKSLGSPLVFRRVKIGEHGRFIVWPGELEFCADALYLDAAKGMGSQT